MNQPNQQKFQSNISWPDLVFYAEAAREPFADVQIITLYSHCLNLAEEKGINIKRIEQAEQVQIFEDRVLVVIDVETIDDEAVTRALDLLTYMDNFKVGNKKEFGPPKQFNYRKMH